jgi:hypothetical protein
MMKKVNGQYELLERMSNNWNGDENIVGFLIRPGLSGIYPKSDGSSTLSFFHRKWSDSNIVGWNVK